MYAVVASQVHSSSLLASPAGGAQSSAGCPFAPPAATPFRCSSEKGGGKCQGRSGKGSGKGTGKGSGQWAVKLAVERAVEWKRAVERPVGSGQWSVQ